MALKKAASAPAVVPPLAVTYDGFQLEARVKSKVLLYVPLETPSGNPAKLGVVVATPALPVSATAVGAWIWDWVVVPNKPLKEADNAKL